MRIQKLLTIVCVAALSTACGNREQPGDDDIPHAASVASSAASGVTGSEGYTVVEVPDGGAIRGTVRFVGTAPAPGHVAVSDDAETCGRQRTVHGLGVGANGGLTHTVVSLIDIHQGAPLETPSTPPVLDQRGCEFVPHVLLAPVGDVRVLNSDPITHNIHTLAFENRPLNHAQPSTVPKIDVSFTEAEKVRVRCDMHEWMGAWIVVMDHPYHALTDDSGEFVLENVPPGTYTLEVWNETLGAITRQVTVRAGQESQVSVEMSSTEDR